MPDHLDTLRSVLEDRWQRLFRNRDEAFSLLERVETRREVEIWRHRKRLSAEFHHGKGDYFPGPYDLIDRDEAMN